MDTAHQLQTFLLCIGVGFVCGIAYEAFAFLRICLGIKANKKKMLGCMVDISFFLTCSIVVILATYLFAFPDFRVYMWAGYLVGGIIYLKTLHKIIAFFEIMWYNTIRKWINKARNQDKTLLKEERKV